MPESQCRRNPLKIHVTRNKPRLQAGEKNIKVTTWRGGADFTSDEAPDPAPEAGQVMIKVDTVGICGSDVHLAHGLFPGEPLRVLGHEFSEVVV